MDTTAAHILGEHAAWKRADDARMNARPAGMPRGAWRGDNPIPHADFPRLVRDLKFKSRPVRQLTFIDHTSRLFVTTINGCPVEIVDLRAPDADQRLSRYAEVRANA